MVIAFDSKDLLYKNPFGAVMVKTVIAFRISISQCRESKNVRLIMILENQWNHSIAGTFVPTEAAPEVTGDQERRVYAFSFIPDEPGLYFYQFSAEDENGKEEKTPLYQLTIFEEGYQTPSFMKQGLMYQIFPDRFQRDLSYTAPKQNKNMILREDWGGTPHLPKDNGGVWNNDFFGGNLKGITGQLSYLFDLGVTVLYLNPIFEAFSNHRYDTANYKKIDPLLGTEEDFKDLCEKAKTHGIRVILDGVFNHTGSHSIYFNKDGAYDNLGAYQSKESPYYEWYSFQDYPDTYSSWWGVDTLPSVNELSTSYVDYIIRDADSVVKHWMRLGASGFRLDVADELPDAFLEALRVAVKSIDPDGVVIGEVWEDASNKIAYGQRRHYLQGRQLDSVMNYPLKDAMLSFVLDGGQGEALRAVLDTLQENYPKESFYALMNILGTHDTKRILTVLKEKDADKAVQRLFLLLILWLFLPGIPCIYYGDELGMQGEKDPFNRGCFQMDQADQEVLRFYRRLLRFRSQIPSMGEMDYGALSCGDGFFSYKRESKTDKLLVFSNVSWMERKVSCPLSKGEFIADFRNSGGLSLLDMQTFSVAENSAVVLWIRKK